MPPKTVVCSVCHQEVLKAQTLEVSPGNRACRSHEGTQAASAQVQQAAKEAEQQRVQEAEQRRRKLMGLDQPPSQAHLDFQKQMEEFRIWQETHCWTCGTPGISMQDFWFTVMVANKQLQLEGRWNFFTMPQDIREKLGPQTVLAVLPYDDQKDGFIRRRIVRRQLKDIIHFLRCVRMCNHCIDKMGLHDRFEDTLPKPTMEQIAEVMPLVAALDPMITELATTPGEN